jgi:hypothetical protein
MPTPTPNFYKIDCEREVVLQGRSTFYITIARNDAQLGVLEDLAIFPYLQSTTFSTHVKDVSIDALSGWVDTFTLTSPGTGGYVTANKLPAYGPGAERVLVDIIANPLSGQIISVNIAYPGGGFSLGDVLTIQQPGSNNDATITVNTVGTLTNAYVKLNNADAANTIPSFSKISNGLELKQFSETGLSSAPKIVEYDLANGYALFDQSLNTSLTSYNVDLGYYEKDGSNWMVNTANADELATFINASANSTNTYIAPNPFDGTVGGVWPDTQYISRTNINRGIIVDSTGGNTNTNGVTFRIDYDGKADSHLKINFLIVKGTSLSLIDIANSLDPNWNNAPYGLKTGGFSGISTQADYQEIHLFGYPESYAVTKRDVSTIDLPISKELFEDRISYGLLKTNPKLSGNVKLTTDSKGSIWLNSFDANNELSNSSYKRFPISSNSTYQKDLWSFFKKGTTPTDIVFDLYQADELYLNNKETYSSQYDNFYNYGVEQLRSKFYDEDYSFLAPIWIRKELPDFFVIFRVNHPINEYSYLSGNTIQGNFERYFNDARIVKTFDMRSSSKLGSYIRKITNDPRYREKPLEVSWENDVPTYWNGFIYKNGTISSKGELLYDFYREDREIKQFEEYITGGFERNGIICTNLLNLEFLFDDEEAPLYGINRYFGLYVTENQLAEFEIEPKVLGKIDNQSPPPKEGVDGEPYSTREFIQTNPEGIQIPISYYHNTALANNDSIVPAYQGLVAGKLPLPELVDDPLRIFYVKDRDDVFKRIIQLSEVDYGYPGTDDYIRATQIKLFDNQENISKYAGVNQITSQFQAEPLGIGNSQLVLQFDDQLGTGVLADDEELTIKVEKYNDFSRTHDYHVQVTGTDGSTFLTLEYFIDQYVDVIQGGFTQPNVGSTVIATVTDTSQYYSGKKLYIVSGGYYTVNSVTSPTTMVLVNNGGLSNIFPGNAVVGGSLVTESLTGQATYTFSATSTLVNIDNYLTINLVDFSVPYNVLDAWKIDVNYPSIVKSIVNGTHDLDTVYKPSYQQFSWKFNANGVGLQPGDCWDYPTYDSEKEEYINNFSNEGTPTQVAQAFAKCVNTFEGLPVVAWSNGPAVYMASTLEGEEGNSILFARYMMNGSVYANLGFYEKNVVNIKAKVDLLPISPSTLDLNVKLIDLPEQPGSASYYFTVYRTLSTAIVTGRTNVVATNLFSATTTGTPFNTGVLNLAGGRLSVNELPFSIDLDAIPLNTTISQVYTVSAGTVIDQLFIGGVSKLRNRVSIKAADGQQYYENRATRRSATITSGSNVVLVDTDGLYVGAPVQGNGIPTGCTIVQVKSTSVLISAVATESGINKILFGEISAFNSKPIYQQWYQTLKGKYCRMKGWEVQGKLLYSLPNLEEATYGDDEKLTGFLGYNTKSIIQVEDPRQEFYLSADERVVAYSVFRPTMGIFSVFPIKTFDFDFFLSDYSYTPTLEAFKYFFDEKVETGDYLELPLFENYKIANVDATTDAPSTAPYSLEISVFDITTNDWYVIETIYPHSANVPICSDILFNTFYPAYDYDYQEYPENPMFIGTGYRNFERRVLHRVDVNGNSVAVYPTRLRVRMLEFQQEIPNPMPPPATLLVPIPVSSYLRITNYNYDADSDLKLFNGFAGLQDITTIDDDDAIQNLKDQGNYIEAYGYQLLFSEYDRLRENYNKDWATRSIVVPYINKWVQEGTDARDNYYRLNNSMAFGVGNLSPLSDIDFAEPSVLTHEWPYLDSVPKGYPEDNLASSRSYMFAKLSDIAAKSATWYDLITRDITQDWFTKYFTAGTPTELNYDDVRVYKPREERFTFFSYNESQGRSFSLFRGAKLQGILFDETDPQNLVEISNSSALQNYKFAAIVRFDSFTPLIKQKPVDIEVFKNDTFKSITVVITIRLQDYRLQSGNLEYMLQYFMNDLLSNSNQQQLKQILPSATNYSKSFHNFYPYSESLPLPFNWTGNYSDYAIMRPRQGFLGGGYLRLGDKRLGGVIIDSAAELTPNHLGAPNYLLTARTETADSSYRFTLSDAITTIQNLYPIDYASGSSPFVYNNTIPTFGDSLITSQNFGQNGYVFNFHTVYNSTVSGRYKLRYFIDNQNANDVINTSSFTIGTGNDANIFTKYQPLAVSYQAINSSSSSVVDQHLTPAFNPVETSLLEGGTQGFEDLRNFLTFGNISALINSDDPMVDYYTVTQGAPTPTQSFKLRIVNPDPIIKNSVLQYLADEDKPTEFTNVGIIGYVLGNTNGQEYILRHRGNYEPKTRDVLSFWVREDNAFSRHYQKDFLLSNTRIDTESTKAAAIQNYGFNKVATSGNILTIARQSAYKSAYPLINEVPVTYSNISALDSTWDANFYRNYSTNANYVSVEGIAEMKEMKSFLASKAMNVPKNFEVHTFLDTEVTFQLVEPALSIGVDNLVTNSTSTDASVPNSNKPKLIITLDLRPRLLRQLIEDITTSVGTDEFERLQTLLPTQLAGLTNQQVEQLRTNYFEKNIIDLYEVRQLVLYAKTQQGIELLDLDLTEQQKATANYVVNKDCVVNKVSEFKFTITKTLEPNLPIGFSLSTTFSRV